MRKMLVVGLFVLCLSTPAMAMYEFERVDTNFGKPTSYEPIEVVEPTDTTNVKRNKDSQFIPPPFASRTADVPGTGDLLTPELSGVAPMSLGGTGELEIYFPIGGGEVGGGSYSGWTDAESIMQADGSIGRLEISRIGVNIKVYEGEDNIAKGAGHFRGTSAWEGNVPLAGHNRGVNAYFGRIHELRDGDVINYSTILGARSYVVYSVRQVHESEISVIHPTQDNVITLVTCVRDVRDKRWVVQARLL